MTNATMAGPTTVLLVPKNRGLVEQVSRALERRATEGYERCDVRGEDIPYLANEFARQGRGVLAYTGDDLVDEWIASGNSFDAKLVRGRTRWEDPKALYGAPALCLIGSGDERRAPAPGAPLVRRVAVCARYRGLAERFLASCAGDGVTYELLFAQGALETLLVQNLADLVIDIVVTGRTLGEAGLRVQRVISTSDLAVLESQPC